MMRFESKFYSGKYAVTNHCGWFCSGFTENQALAIVDKFNRYEETIQELKEEKSGTNSNRTSKDRSRLTS